MQLTQTQLEMVSMAGVAIACSRAMGRQDPTDDELLRLLSTEFPADDVIRQLPVVREIALDSQK